jgi:aminopeptidase N
MRILSICILLVSIYPLTAQDLISGGKLKPEQAIMDIRHYTINLEVMPETQSIEGFTEIKMITSEPTSTLLLDLVNLLKVDKIEVNGKEESFEHENDLIHINLNQTLPAGESFVNVSYGGKPGIATRPPWEGGFGWDQDSLGNPWISISCQGEGIKIFVPCKDHPSDEPNEGAEMIITVPKGLVVAGPGLLKNVETKKGKSTYHWETNYTINNYSMLFNIGKFVVVSRDYTTCDGNKVPMQFYVLEEHAHLAKHHLDILERNMRVEEKYFGEYPWVKEKIGICETAHLGMEHQTMNAYGNKFKYRKIGGKDFDGLMHHELGHEWWGNKVTGVDFSDMWIQEGICVFGDAMYTREYAGEEAYQKRMAQTARSARNQYPIKMGDNLGSDTTYHSDVYGKAAFFMHTVRYVIGDDIFFPTLKKLATNPDYTYDNLVSTDDVEQLFSSESDQNLKPLFDFCLRTVNKFEIQIKQVNDITYQIYFLNYKGSLPMDVQTHDGTKRLVISDESLEIYSNTLPIIDPKTFYIKKIIIE